MKSSKFWIAVLVTGIVANVIDYCFYALWMGPRYMATNPTLFRLDTNPVWFIIGDFIGVFVFAWVLDKTLSSFGSGAKAGVYLGVLVSFPTYIFMHLMFNGYPYALSWISTIYGIVWYVAMGAILAAMMKKGTAAA